MTLNIFIIQLAVLFLPGLVWEQMDARFAAKDKPSQVEFLARALIFGILSHSGTFGLYKLTGFDFEIVDFASADKKLVINGHIIVQVAIAIAVGFLLALVWLKAASKRWLPNFLIKCRITTRYGDEDVWDFVFNSPGVGSTWVYVRDFEKKLTYTGYVSSYSQNAQLRELALTEVSVYDFDGALFFTSPRVYLSMKSESVHIEFPLAAPVEELPNESVSTD